MTMRCIECEEIELARVRDERAAADAADPVRGARRLPGRPLGRRPDAPAAAAVGRRRRSPRSTAPRRSASSRSGSRSRTPQTAPEQKTLVVLYLAGGNDGLNVLVPNARPPTTAPTRAARPSIHRGQGASTAGPRRLDARCPGAGGAALAFANVVVSKNGGGDNSATRFGFTGTGGDGFGFDALYGDGTRRCRLGPGDHAGGRRQAVQPEPLRQLGHLVPGLATT